MLSYQSLFSKGRFGHAAVVLSTTGEDKIFLLGGGSRYSGERVNGRLHKLKNQFKIECFLLIKGETQLSLQSGGWGMCALPFNTGFVTIGGLGVWPPHGKVDRCSNHNCHHHPLSAPGTTLKENSWDPFLTWPHQELTTAAPVFSRMASRQKYPQLVQLSFFSISNRPCLLLEVGIGLPFYRAPRFTSHQQMNGQQKETFPGENICHNI